MTSDSPPPDEKSALDPLTSISAHAEPTVAIASPRGWRAWLQALLARGQERLSAFGLTLLLGFGGGALALYAFAILAEGVTGQATMEVDGGVLAWLRQFSSPTLDAAATIVSAFGSEIVAVLLVVLLGVFTYQRRWGAAAGLLLVTVGAQLLNNLLKDAFQRARPSPVSGMIHAQSFSFPSGHAMVSMAFYLFLAYLSWRVLRGPLRIVMAGGLVVLVLAIGVSRMYLGVHYLTDVLAGYIAGFLWTDAVIIGARLLAMRRRTASGAPVAADAIA